ncbi:MAG: hypothetical protein ACRDVC_01550 [Acidimicrobiales bacterium]
MTMNDITITPPAAMLVTASDHRGSWIPTWSMITTRFMELRKRRGLMIALVVVNIGIPTIFLVVRLFAHAFAPHSYGPAGGYDIFTNLVAVVIYVFGFIVAATLGCTAGSIDLTEGMYRHLVVTGRSRLALYLARIPAGLAIVTSLVAVGFAIVCLVCVFAAPKTISYDGANNIQPNMSISAFDTYAQTHLNVAICDLPYRNLNINVPCQYDGHGGGKIASGNRAPTGFVMPSHATLEAYALQIANQDYSSYRAIFLSPPVGLMVRAGLWVELEAAIGFIVGLGLGSLLGQRTISVILMLVLELVLTPIFSTHVIPHLINFQRSIVGLATAHLEPAGLPLIFGGGGNGPQGASLLVPETRAVAICVIVAWLVVWTALGAWRMMTRDA